MNGLSQGTSAPLAVASPDLIGGTFPREFTCDGANRGAPRITTTSWYLRWAPGWDWRPEQPGPI
jgi:hypothetical protein